MRYSWIQFAIGVAVGLVMIATMFFALCHFLFSLVLFAGSSALLFQAPRRAPAPSSATSDIDEWRELGRGLVSGRGLVPAILFGVVFALAFNAVVQRYPSVTELVAPTVFTTIWLVHVAIAVRIGRSRSREWQPSA